MYIYIIQGWYKEQNIIFFISLLQVAVSLQEYRREKNLKQRRRLLDEKAAAFLEEHGEIKQGKQVAILCSQPSYH